METEKVSMAEKIRRNLALFIIGLVTIGLTIITCIIVRNAFASGRNEVGMVKEVFHSLLPVLASWVGTVLAFYFGKENFDAANKSVQDIVSKITNSDDKLRATKVSDANAMLLLSNIEYNKSIAGKDDASILVKVDLLDFIEANKKGKRLPIINEAKVVRYIIHESTINEFARKLASNAFGGLTGKSFDAITLAEMINNSNDEMKSKIFNSLAFVSKNATLLEAREKMKANPNCQDVFVTENGLSSEPVIGWVTNNTITELSKI